MITSFSIKEVSDEGTLVEYFDDRNISITLNLIPPFNFDGSAMTEEQLRNEILRHTPSLSSQIDEKVISKEWIKTPILLMEKQIISAQDLQDAIFKLQQPTIPSHIKDIL